MHMDGKILAQVISGEKRIMVLFVYTPAYKLNTHDKLKESFRDRRCLSVALPQHRPGPSISSILSQSARRSTHP